VRGFPLFFPKNSGKDFSGVQQGERIEMTYNYFDIKILNNMSILPERSV